jgi:Mn-dependent DtxR family transcriptional regulator
MDDITLNDDERKVLEVLGKLHISKNKNVHEATIRKKLPQKYQGNLPKTIKSLHSKGLLRYYRNENYSLTKEGVIMAKTLAEEAMKKQYGDLVILLVV